MFSEGRNALVVRLAVIAVCLVTVSAVWVESDAYRYSVLALIAATLIGYYKGSNESAPLEWASYACFGWSAYVALRYGWVFWNEPGKHGSAEGLYLFPLAFPFLGHAFTLVRRQITGIADIFMLISLLLLTVTIDFTAVLDSVAQRPSFLFQNNLIHASVAGGLIAISAIAYAESALWNRSSFPPVYQCLRIVIASLVLLLALFAIYGAKSKGVWLALAISIPLQTFASLSRLPLRHALLGGGVVLLAVVVGAALAEPVIVHVLTPYWMSALRLLADVNARGLAAVHEIIVCGPIPSSFGERLMLWSNALEVFAVHPWFGSGVSWDAIWKTTRYADLKYNLIHNGYAELAVRYGITGLIFFAVLFGVFSSWILKATHRDHISPHVAKLWFISLLFFAVTLFTNSNNRLAIGESLILISAGFAFHARYLIRR